MLVRDSCVIGSQAENSIRLGDDVECVDRRRKRILSAQYCTYLRHPISHSAVKVSLQPRLYVG